MNNALGYFGKYEISLETATVIHKVEGGTIPFYIGTNQPRPFRLEGDTLTIGDGKTWRRVLVKVAE
jgi:GH24 family phage-related lysozyme (muramidase)